MPGTETIDYDRINSLVPRTYMKKIKDQFFGLNAALKRAEKRQVYKTGPAVVVPLSFTTEGGGGQFYKGADRFDMRVHDPFGAAVYHWSNAVVPVVVTGDDELAVTGGQKVEDLFTAKFNVAKNTMIDLLGGTNGLFSDGTNPKGIGGLQLAIPAAGAGTGVWVNDTYGGIASATYTWWRSQVDNNATTGYVTGDGQTFAHDDFEPIEKMLTKIALACDRRPTLGLTNWGTYGDIRRALIKSERYGRPQQNSELAKVGFVNILYADIPIVADRRSPRGATPTYYEEFRFIDENSMHYIVHPERDMKYDGFMKAFDQDARAAKIYHRCQIGFDERRSSGCISLINTAQTS